MFALWLLYAKYIFSLKQKKNFFEVFTKFLPQILYITVQI